MKNQHKIALFIWFYVGWFACVYLAKSSFSNWSLCFPLLPLLALSKYKLHSSRQMLFLLALSGLGCLFDFVLYRMNLIGFVDYNGLAIPIWLVSLWLLFSSVFFLSHTFFKDRLLIAGIAGAVFGPLSYYSGESFQVLRFTHPATLLIYAIFWGLFFPGLHFLVRKIKWT